jgi:hypothetical protein
MDRVILGLNLDAQGVSVSYMTLPADIRATGLAAQHSLLIPVDGDYDDGIETLRDAALALLEDALEDFDKVPAFEPVDQDDGDGDDDD